MADQSDVGDRRWVLSDLSYLTLPGNHNAEAADHTHAPDDLAANHPAADDAAANHPAADDAAANDAAADNAGGDAGGDDSAADHTCGHDVTETGDFRATESRGLSGEAHGMDIGNVDS